MFLYDFTNPARPFENVTFGQMTLCNVIIPNALITYQSNLHLVGNILDYNLQKRIWYWHINNKYTRVET